jgi:predicted glycoside hydrolase/deacetylase ChbG (UPF0249 family)
MKKKMLIVNADDFGMSEEISDGIITAHLEGIVTSTSLMVNMPDAERAVRLAQQTPSLDVGIHLNITEGVPVLPSEKVPTLVNSTGEFLPDKKLIPKIKKFRVSPFEIEAEFSAQISKMLDMGIRPTHLDSHHHVHIYPLSAWAFKRVTKKFGIKKVRAIRYHLPYFSNRKRLEHYKNILIIFSKNIYKLIIQKFLWHEMVSPNFLVTTSILFPQSNLFDVKEKWIKLLLYLPDGIIEANCHPGYESKGTRNSDFWSEKRKNELNALTSFEVKDMVKKKDIELINFSALH